MEKYEINLKNEKLRLYNQISWIIIFLHVIVFSYLSLFIKNNRVQSGSIVSLIILLSCFLLGYYLFKKRSSWFSGFHVFYSCLLIGWIIIGWYWLILVPVLFDILVTLATRKLLTIFSEEKIIYPSFPQKIFEWKELNNIILKDGLLTIDLKTNKLIQQYIDDNSSPINEKKFNEFCRQQLNK